MTKENVIAKVQDSLGSLFTKDDVINCINLVEETPKVESQPIDYQEVLNLIKKRVMDIVDDFSWDDSNSYEITELEFSIRYGNNIELDSYEVDASQQKREMIDQIRDLFNELEEDERLSSNEALKEAMED